MFGFHDGAGGSFVVDAEDGGVEGEAGGRGGWGEPGEEFDVLFAVEDAAGV